MSHRGAEITESGLGGNWKSLTESDTFGSSFGRAYFHRVSKEQKIKKLIKLPCQEILPYL